MPYGSPSTLIYRPQPQPSRITIPTAGSPASRLVPCSVTAQTEAHNLLTSLLATNRSLSDPLILCYSIFLNPRGTGLQLRDQRDMSS